MITLRPERSATVAAPGSDLRFALETMAQMMRTNSDALRLVAESQVDLAKTIASVKGLPRNAAMFLPQTPPANVSIDEDDDDEEEADDESQPAPTTYLDLLMPFSEALAGKVADRVPGLLRWRPRSSRCCSMASTSTRRDSRAGTRPKGSTAIPDHDPTGRWWCLPSIMNARCSASSPS